MSSLRERCDAVAWHYADPPDPQWLEVATLIAEHYIPPATGRPSVIGNKETIARLFTHLARGNYLDCACNLAGVTEVTVRALEKRGEAGEEPFDAFLAVLKRAESKAEADAVGKVLKAGDDPRFWTAPATWLERKFPHKFGRRQEESAGPKVQVIFGVVEGEVNIGQVNVIANYQTPNELSPTDSLCKPLLSEGESAAPVVIDTPRAAKKPARGRRGARSGGGP